LRGISLAAVFSSTYYHLQCRQLTARREVSAHFPTVPARSITPSLLRDVRKIKQKQNLNVPSRHGRDGWHETSVDDCSHTLTLREIAFQPRVPWFDADLIPRSHALNHVRNRSKRYFNTAECPSPHARVCSRCDIVFV
jgi:hypothetical protein